MIFGWRAINVEYNIISNLNSILHQRQAGGSRRGTPKLKGTAEEYTSKTNQPWPRLEGQTPQNARMTRCHRVHYPRLKDHQRLMKENTYYEELKKYIGLFFTFY